MDSQDKFSVGRLGYAEELSKETMWTAPTGARRSELVQARYDLIPSHALQRLALRYALGASKYGEWNWQKGFPLSDLLNHAVVHATKYRDRFVAAKAANPHLDASVICQIVAAETSDDDLAGAAWGFFTMMELEKLGRLS